MRRLAHALSLLLAVAGLALAAPGAQAKDSHAPAHARGDWLPSAEWVMSSWLPYDEARLHVLLRTDRAELATWLDDRRSLGALARKRGWSSMDRLAGALVAPRRGRVSATTFRALRRHAKDTLTQPHLARHVLFHVFHTAALAPAAPRLFGMSAARFRRLRDRGLSPSRIAGAGSRGAAGFPARMSAFLAERGRRAVRVGASSRAQADALLAVQRADLARFARTPYRTPAQQAVYAQQAHHGVATHDAPAALCLLAD